MNEQDKYKAIVMLHEGREPKDISEVLAISLSSTIRLKQEYDKAKTENNLSMLLNSEEAINALAAELTPITQELVGEVVKELKGLEKLQENFQKTGELISNKVRVQIAMTDSVSDIVLLTECVATLQKAFFPANNAPQVNMQNNYGNSGSAAYSEFLSDKPGS